MARRAALVLIRGYQLILSPVFGGACRYVPSCSEYAAEAITRFGVVRGSLRAAARLARCHPLGGHGFDPVIPDSICEPLPEPATADGIHVPASVGRCPSGGLDSI